MSQIQKKNRWKSFLVFFKYSKEKIGIFKFEFSSRAPPQIPPTSGFKLGEERERERERDGEGGRRSSKMGDFKGGVSTLLYEDTP
jgi:hypothetical protein